MSYMSHPLIGDVIYGGRPRPPRHAPDQFIRALRALDRQALHARMLRLSHPITGELMEWHAPLPNDMIAMIDILRKDNVENSEDNY